jgi:hypothetical protein
MTNGTPGSTVCPEERNSPERLMVKEAVMEMVLGSLARGEPVLAVARAHGHDPKTVRAWRRRGRCAGTRRSGRFAHPVCDLAQGAGARAPGPHTPAWWLWQTSQRVSLLA